MKVTKKTNDSRCGSYKKMERQGEGLRRQIKGRVGHSVRALLCGYLVFACAGVARSADDIPISEDSLTIEEASGKTVTVDLKAPPANAPVAVLSFSAWIEHKVIAGALPVLQVSLNGSNLTQALGRAKDITFEADGRQNLTFTPNSGWLLFYGSGPDQFRSYNQYRVSETFDPTAFKLVLEEFSPGKATIEFVNTRKVGSTTLPIAIKVEDIKVEYLSEKEANAYKNE